MIDDIHCTSDPLLRRAIAANVAGRGPENLYAIIRFACRPELSGALRTLAWEQVHNWAMPSSRDSVNGDWRPLAPRPATELADALNEAMPQLVKMSAHHPEGLVVAAEACVENAFAPLLAVLSNDAQPEAIRVRSIAAFGKASDALAHQAIDAGIKSPNEAVRSAARKLWADRFPSQVVEQLTSTLEMGTTHERQAAIDALATLNTEAANAQIRGFFEQLEKGNCPPELQVEVLEAAGKSKDEKLVEREKQFIEKKASNGPLEPYRGCVSGGDANRGRKIFETNDTFACRRCHSIKPGEVLVGPCLANVGAQRKPDDILESIVTPNAKICEGFETAVLQLDSGKILTGIIRHESDTKIELVDANAKMIEVDPSSVENRVKGKSPMPENLMNQMSRRELRDLIAFLGRLKTAEPATDGAASK
jgi:quinoprotein glucose dehydrogenase